VKPGEPFETRPDESAAVELVAYLDGELDGAASEQVERRLSEDAAYRQQLRALQRTWDLMDHLPRVDLDEQFTQSTLTMVAVRAAGDAEVGQSQGRRRRRQVWWAGLAGTVVAFAGGYLAVQHFMGQANRQLLRDLPVIERLDEYRYADSVPLLRLLDEQGLFAEDELEPSSPAVTGDDVLADRRQRVEQMSPAEKQELWELQQRFYRLDPEQRDRLRQLHAEMENQPEAERLRAIMARYANWLKTLPAGERAELLSLPPEERIAQIRAIVQRQATSQMRYLVADELSDRDLAAIVFWMKDIVRRREPEILQKLPMLPRGMLDAMGPEQRVETMVRAIHQRFGLRPDLLRPTAEDIQRLKEQLSPAAVGRMEQAREEGQLTELAENWIRAALAGRRGGPPVDRAELERFYREELDEDEREFLESLPRERMHSRLMLLYYAHRSGRPVGPDSPPLGPRGMGGAYRGRGPRFWPPERKPEPDDIRRKPPLQPPGPGGDTPAARGGETDSLPQ
jgi:hypothetical protein